MGKKPLLYSIDEFDERQDRAITRLFALTKYAIFAQLPSPIIPLLCRSPSERVQVYAWKALAMFYNYEEYYNDRIDYSILLPALQESLESNNAKVRKEAVKMLEITMFVETHEADRQLIDTLVRAHYSTLAFDPSFKVRREFVGMLATYVVGGEDDEIIINNGVLDACLKLLNELYQLYLGNNNCMGSIQNLVRPIERLVRRASAGMMQVIKQKLVVHGCMIILEQLSSDRKHFSNRIELLLDTINSSTVV